MIRVLRIYVLILLRNICVYLYCVTGVDETRDTQLTDMCPFTVCCSVLQCCAVCCSVFFSRYDTRVGYKCKPNDMRRGGGLGSRPKKMYGKILGDGVEYHLMSPTPSC